MFGFTVVGGLSGIGFRLVREARLFGGLKNGIRHQGKDLFVKSARDGAVGAGTGFITAKCIRPAKASPVEDLLKGYENLIWEKPEYSSNVVAGTFKGGRIGALPCMGTRALYDGFDPEAYYQIGVQHANGSKATFPVLGKRLPALAEHLKRAERPPARPVQITQHPVSTRFFKVNHPPSVQ